MTELAHINENDARQLWATLAEEGKAPTELVFASLTLPSYSVCIDPWLDRIVDTYLRGLCRQHAHFKLVIAPYGGGKTHFLMSLGTRALREGYGVSYIACTQGINLDSPLDVYRAFIKQLQLPGEGPPGLRRLLEHVVSQKRSLIAEANAPDPDRALDFWLRQVSGDEYPESSFGRVMADALRRIDDPTHEIGEAAIRWLRGDVDTLTKDELAVLRLSRIPAKAHAELGRGLLPSVIRFAKEHTGIHGVVLLFDEVETLFNARGKALDRVLSAMRVMLDMPGGIQGGIPLFGLFSAVPDVLEQLTRYAALEQRVSVKGASFEEGNDLSPQLALDRIGKQDIVLQEVGYRLIALGTVATGHKFRLPLQRKNVDRLVKVATERSLQVDARRLFVKTCVSLLQLQIIDREREFDEGELGDRYNGNFESLQQRETQESEP